MDRKRRLLTDWKVASAFLVVLAIGFAILYFNANATPYRFLAGRTPFYSRIEELHGSFREQQAYSWNGKFEDVRKQASKELTSLGFDELLMRDGMRSQTYLHTDRVGVKVQYGRTSSLPDIYLNPNDAPPGVTVVIDRELPSNWLTKARMWLQPK